MSELAFFPCKGEPEILMLKLENIFEYIAVYINDLENIMKMPKEFDDTDRQAQAQNIWAYHFSSWYGLLQG
jgi:hypothetical protein